MTKFDFIREESFRHVLEEDYTELEATLKVKAWKAVHVLAGSIIEALLVDHLIASEYQKRTSKDPLRMDLKDIISICRQENVLTERTEQLSQVIRGYRNLIHPTRIEREKEIVNEDGAFIARSLVNMIIEEISTRKSKIYGYTAEQIITKMEIDNSTSAILNDLIKDINEYEKNRLLEIIPQRYIYFYFKVTENYESLDSLSTCFRIIYDNASDVAKKKVAKELVKIIKEASQPITYIYETTFFRATDLIYFETEDARLVKQHLFSALSTQIRTRLLESMKEIGKFLIPDDVPYFIEPFIKALNPSAFVDAPISTFPSFLWSEYSSANQDVKNNIIERFEKRKSFYQVRGNTAYEMRIQELFESIMSPF